MAPVNDLLAHEIIGAAIEVHRLLGPGMLESAYEEFLALELSLRRLEVRRQQGLPVVYKGHRLPLAYRLDLVVEDQVVLELKCVDKLIPAHDAQILTYMRLSQIEKGLLMNFNASPLIHGIKRFVLSRPRQVVP